ncbi:GGDEF domain-containing protein [Alloacidobacterium dinghuense]|uniref:GGDEF domain-containing protein n=1 Tax=Alloacidobacterium dinghuense TaxID=2763107 RepID=A0A7G8BMD7_9BACT|nr:sensor domain-containing diguanylate cyclase [Alloacidobacterium dinghuense]QNI33707.1 GGDEF domain-containing protein [Alloacidobacterium dinghuense]
MQDRLLDILILGLLVLLFGVIYRKVPSRRLRYWIAGWLFALAHFAVLLPRVPALFWQEIQVALGMSGLVLCGICFVLASSAFALRNKSLIWVGAVLSIPPLIYVFLVIFGYAAVWPLSLFAIAGEAMALWIGWRFNRQQRIVLWANNLTVVGCGAWLLWLISRQDADIGIYAILTQLFLINAVLYWNDFRRLSAGVITASAGLLAWAAVFPTALTIAHFFPHLSVPGELWNVPKYFVEFGMILTLLENQIYTAHWQSEQYRVLFDSNPHPMFIYDTKTFAFLRVNDAALEEYGYSRPEFLHMSIGDLHEVAALAGVERLLADTHSSIKVTGPWTQRRRDGSEFQAEISSHPIEFEGCDARLSLVQDVTDRERLHEQLVHRAHHDSLTNLPNRFLFEQRMRHTLENASRYAHKAAILCIDLDRFKQINDNHGHATGDACLQEIANRLTNRLRESDTVARTGGEEFTVVIGELLHGGDAEKVAADLLTEFRHPFTVDGVEMQLSASVGVALYPDHGTEGAQLWRAADIAMYRAKYSGGNRSLLVSHDDVEYCMPDKALARHSSGNGDDRR